jgi:hypothetical protein
MLELVLIVGIIECVGIFQMFGVLGILLSTKLGGGLLINVSQIIGYRRLMIIGLIGQVGIRGGKIIIPMVILMAVRGLGMDLVVLTVLLLCLVFI